MWSSDFLRCVVMCCFVLRLGALALLCFFFFLMIRRPPRSTLDRSSAASDVYKRQIVGWAWRHERHKVDLATYPNVKRWYETMMARPAAVSYTHLRAHETVLDLVCRLLLEKKKNTDYTSQTTIHNPTPSNEHRCPHSISLTITHHRLTQV